MSGLVESFEQKIEVENLVSLSLHQIKLAYLLYSTLYRGLRLGLFDEEINKTD